MSLADVQDYFRSTLRVNMILPSVLLIVNFQVTARVQGNACIARYSYAAIEMATAMLKKI